MKSDTDLHIGQEVIRDADGVPGKITRREGDRYIINWSDNSVGFVLVAAMEEGHRQWLEGFKPKPRNIQQRAQGAKAMLDAIRAGQAVAAIEANAGASNNNLSAADQQKILARLRADGPSPVSDTVRPANPAQRPSAGHDKAFREQVSGHVKALLGEKAKPRV